MFGSIRYQDSLPMLGVKIAVLIALLLTIAFAFAKVSTSASVSPHAQSLHTYQLACGGELAPQCG